MTHPRAPARIGHFIVAGRAPTGSRRTTGAAWLGKMQERDVDRAVVADVELIEYDEHKSLCTLKAVHRCFWERQARSEAARLNLAP